MEETYIRNIENGFRGLKMGLKTPATCNVAPNLNKLKGLNLGLYYDYFNDYKQLIKEYSDGKFGEVNK